MWQWLHVALTNCCSLHFLSSTPFCRCLEALLSKDGGLLVHRLEEFEHDLASALVQEKGPGRWLRAYIRSCQSEGIEVETINGLIAALATNPGLLEPMRQKYSARPVRVESDGLPPPLARFRKP